MSPDGSQRGYSRKKSKMITSVISLIVLSFLAVYLSYSSISSFKTQVRGMLVCHDDQAKLTITNEGDEMRIYYISVERGDNLLELDLLNRILGKGESLTIQLSLPRGCRISILMDKGVIPGLECGGEVRSQP